MNVPITEVSSKDSRLNAATLKYNISDIKLRNG